LSTGVSGTKAAFDESNTLHDQNKDKWNDIFSSSAAVVGGVGGLPGLSGTTTGKALTGIAGMFS
jgi:hypothetical protein